MNLGIPAEKNPYRPDSASGKSVGLAHCHIGLMTFYFQIAPPHLGSECLTLGLSILYFVHILCTPDIREAMDEYSALVPG